MYGEFAREYGALLESAFDLAPVYITARRLSRSLPARASLCHTSPFSLPLLLAPQRDE
jgi:hypothetical protein